MSLKRRDSFDENNWFANIPLMFYQWPAIPATGLFGLPGGRCNSNLNCGIQAYSMSSPKNLPMGLEWLPQACLRLMAFCSSQA